MGGRPNIEDRLKVFNGRGRAFNLSTVLEVVHHLEAEVVIFDPLYKMMDGGENAAEEMKPILAEFGRIAEETGAAIVYVHHDPKGDPGMRSARDRGAGSGVVGRDYDALFALSEHQEDNHTVVDLLLRNYPPHRPFVIEWREGAFRRASCPAVRKRPPSPNQNETTGIPDEELVPKVVAVLAEMDGEPNAGKLDEELRKQLHLTKRKAGSVRNLAVSQGAVLVENTAGGGKKFILPESDGKCIAG
jgi:hypothetical protein